MSMSLNRVADAGQQMVRQRPDEHYRRSLEGHLSKRLINHV